MKTGRAINKEELKNVLPELISEDADFSVLLLREEPVNGIELISLSTFLEIPIEFIL
ncbi:hypothetical protein JGI1_00901 [Candidatus Thermokryptus mobilis]|uniref:Uncharacterized protein n=1 Tax=Candidatus Thermokryptus mobilis TaxID=1643428 RepID=A0A0S4N2G6_9BACT|nr:hypothetical protein [Candidatus Thermokryptus mobilis]CUU04109.1 hypothetical protein JGI1_00901 [Candidatus Thermokryptus mobilis]